MDRPTRGSRRSYYLDPELPGWIEAWQLDAVERAGVGVSRRRIETCLGGTQVLRAGAGPHIVCLPGWGINSGFWVHGRGLGALIEIGNVSLVDVPGQPGMSGPWAPRRWPDGYGRWLEDVLDALGIESAHLVGSSYGAGIALAASLALGARVERLVLLAPAGFVHPLPRPRALRASAAHHLKPTRERSARFVRACLLGEQPDLGDERERAIAELLFRTSRGFRNRSPLPWTFSDATLASVSAPTHLLLGADDPIFSAPRTASRARRAMSTIASVDLVTRAAHLLECSREAIECTAKRIAQG